MLINRSGDELFWGSSALSVGGTPANGSSVAPSKLATLKTEEVWAEEIDGDAIADSRPEPTTLRITPHLVANSSSSLRAVSQLSPVGPVAPVAPSFDADEDDQPCPATLRSSVFVRRARETDELESGAYSAHGEDEVWTDSQRERAEAHVEIVEIAG